MLRLGSRAELRMLGCIFKLSRKCGTMTLERIDTPRTRRDGTPWSSTAGMSLRRMDDVVTSNYKTLVASGKLVNKTCSSFSYVCSARTSDYVGTWTLFSLW